MEQFPKFNTENKVLDGSFDQFKNKPICLMEICAGESESIIVNKYIK